MKRTLKITISLVLAIALLIAACWFFLFYNPNAMTNLLHSSAQVMADRGRYERAVKLYEMAWKLMPDRTELPQELAQTYIASGNYTKAEYTLVSAISASPDEFDLYAALSRTYVAQDKLLDAVNMLDRINSQTVQDRLLLERPAAPEVTPDSGFYNEHIEVSVQSPEALVYTTTDGEYPSNDSDLYTGPITMETGETTIIALAVSESGLVSPAAVCGYTVGGVVEEVTLADPAVEDTVRRLLSLSDSDPILSSSLWTIASLELPETVTTLQDLSFFTGLRSLTIHNISGLDFTNLRLVPALQILDLSGCTVSSDGLSAIGSLTELQELSMDSCALVDLTPLSALTKLVHLQLSNNSITDISILALMPDLETLSIANNPVSSLGGLSACSKLQELDITRCGVTSISSLAEKKALTTLMASNNQIADLSSLSDCKSLSTLSVSNNILTDVSVLAALPELTVIEADHNQLTAIPEFNDTSKLTRFSASYNEISDLSGLSGIDSLNYVNLDYNKIKNIDSMIHNINLVQLDVWDNPIPTVSEAVKPFEEASVIVNFNPNFKAE